MIFPLLHGLVQPLRAPITYFLLFVNLVVFLGTSDAFDQADQRIDVIMNDQQFLSSQGDVFAQMIKRDPRHYSETLQDLARSASRADLSSRRTLGGLALRNSLFMVQAPDFQFAGDEIETKAWRAKFLELRETQSMHPAFQWGVTQDRGGPLQWVTYQFAHSGFAHLFWNMVFLLIFGIMVEVELGGSFVILTYLGGGIFGAYAFSEMSGFSASPLVGASAAVTGLMGLVAFHWWNKSEVRFFYWLLPIQGYFGFKMFPGWVVLLVTFLPDLSGFLSTSGDFGSVAHSAHIGGLIFGGIMACALHMHWLVKEATPSLPDAT
jgi:membrane associated rhomboid family serine protease